MVFQSRRHASEKSFLGEKAAPRRPRVHLPAGPASCARTSCSAATAAAARACASRSRERHEAEEFFDEGPDHQYLGGGRAGSPRNARASPVVGKCFRAHSISVRA